MPVAKTGHFATLLASGQMLLTGGSDYSNIGHGQPRSAEINR
jgi:hypothetical protein